MTALNPFYFPTYTGFIRGALLVLFSALITFSVTRLTYQSRLNAEKLSHQMALNAITAEAFLATKDTLAQLKHAQEKHHQLDEIYLQRLSDEQNESQRLRDDLLTERRVVQFAKADLATCELTRNRTARTGSVGNDATVRLTQKAGLLVHDLRTDIQHDHAKITYLQGYIRDVVNQCKVPHENRN